MKTVEKKAGALRPGDVIIGASKQKIKVLGIRDHYIVTATKRRRVIDLTTDTVGYIDLIPAYADVTVLVPRAPAVKRFTAFEVFGLLITASAITAMAVATALAGVH